MSINITTIEPVNPPSREGAGSHACVSHEASRATGYKASVLTSSTLGFFGFITFYIFPGLVGHEPWKQDETYIVEIVRHMSATSDFVVPTMAGEPFMEKPPLFYWVAVALAKLLSSAIAFHDAARIATGVFLALTCGAVARCARKWFGREFGRTAVLVLLACLGMEAYAHLMLTDIALLAGVAVGLAGLPHWRERPGLSGLEVGTGIGLGFMAKGLFAPGIFAVSAVLLPIFFCSWRQRAYLRMVCFAAVAMLPWLLIWPATLYLRSPALFSDWLWFNNVGRFVGFSVPVLGAAHDDGFWLKNLWWITLPAAPLALVTLWRMRRSIRDEEMLQVTVIFAAVITGVLAFSASARGGYALPLLIPVSLLGARSAVDLPRSIESGWRFLARVGFSALAGAIWFLWAYLMYFRSTDAFSIPILEEGLAPDLDRQLHWVLLCLSAVATLVVAVLAWSSSQTRALQTWVLGLALSWMLLVNLLMPWVDQVKSYKDVFASLGTAMPTDADCVASLGLGESERAMLRYYQGIVTKRLEELPTAQCSVMVVEGRLDEPNEKFSDDGWKNTWDGARPVERREHFWLYERKN